tara:strand:- start:292 stop:1296 length:1005 start_codon:yes stop_codon:yes gene_type:complete
MHHKEKLYIFWVLLFFLIYPANAAAREVTHTIPVPFTPQAPEKNWEQPWQDACEEASVVMVDAFYQDKALNTQEAKRRILEIFAIKEQYFGVSLDESIETLSSLINLFLPWESQVVYSPTLNEIISELSKNRPVIVPVHGADLHNPHFLSSTVQYHMIVLSGYDPTTKEFITQEPGTQHGLDYRYSYATIVNAIANLGHVRGSHLSKAVLFTKNTIKNTGFIDRDADGLSKKQEVLYGTKTYISDTDGDGYSDGLEVTSGYLPTLNEYALEHGSLIKTEKNPKVYLLEKGKKHHIANEQVFLANNWKWHNIKTVSDRYIASLTDGAPIKEKRSH